MWDLLRLSLVRSARILTFSYRKYSKQLQKAMILLRLYSKFYKVMDKQKVELLSKKQLLKKRNQSLKKRREMMILKQKKLKLEQHKQLKKQLRKRKSKEEERRRRGWWKKSKDKKNKKQRPRNSQSKDKKSLSRREDSLHRSLESQNLKRKAKVKLRNNQQLVKDKLLETV